MYATLRKLKFKWEYWFLGKHRSTSGSDIPCWKEPPPLKGQLWFGTLLVADLYELFPQQGTWFAGCRLRINREQGELQDQLLAYISFCEGFNRRIAEGRVHDFDEFDAFSPIPTCKSWRAELPNGCRVPMEGRMWFADGAVSWQHSETDPSVEVVANDFWIQNASIG